MIKQALRLAIMAGVWKRYKATIVSILLLLTFLLMLSIVHGEFLDYSQSIGSKRSVGLSFIVKWLLGCSGLGVFFLYHFYWRSWSDKKSAKPEKNRVQSETKKDKVAAALKANAAAEAEPAAPDPFQSLRDKPSLRSRGDIALEQSKNQN